MQAELSFGLWIKQRRKTLDLSRDELARRVGCAVSTIRKLEIEARRPSRQIAERLAEQLDIPPEQRAAFVQLARATSSDQPAPVPAPPPSGTRAARPPVPLTPLVGRAPEAAAVCARLTDPGVRLLTLLGPPGVGKTRLALQVAADLRNEFAHGVVWVSLAPLHDPSLVPITVAQALGVAEAGNQPLIERLQQHLRSKELLLVLDNLEQLIDAAPPLAELLAEAPAVKALVTSREPLHVYGEHEYIVPPLSIPGVGAPSTAAELADYEAIRLFVARAQAVRADFVLDDRNAAAVAGICVRLDGLPLAIELAAARAKLFDPAALLGKLDAPLSVLTGGPRERTPRQQTLRDAIGWSYELLSADEQALFRRLGVFVGGWTADGIENVELGTEQGKALNSRFNILNSLVDKSLVRSEIDATGATRYSMLEMIREYARERLAAHGETQHMERAHALYYMSFAQAAEPQLTGADEAAWASRLALEYDNLRAALIRSRSSADGAEVGLRLAAALGKFWRMRSWLSEGRLRLADALARAPEAPELATTRAKALEAAGWLAFVQGDHEPALRLFEQSLALHRELNSTDGIIRLLNRLAATASFGGDYAPAQSYLEEALALAEGIGNRYLIANSLNGLGELARLGNDYARARDLYEASLRLKREAGERMGTAVVLHNVARVALHQGDFATTAASFGEALAIFRELGSQLDMCMCLAGLASISVVNGDPETGARWLGATDVTLDQLGAAIWPADRAAYEQDRAAVQAALAPDVFAGARAAGRAMALEQAVVEGLSYSGIPAGEPRQTPA